ncbi:MAG: hypothetical protein ACP6IQ_05600 [Candidatus Njordarchaeia archaeon]|nr:hypothetical protein [Candidatus Korarchaeota archaeon]
MPASYLERAIWNFIKTNILGGVPLFFKRETLPLTISIGATLFLQYYLGVSSFLLTVTGILLFVIGLALYKSNLKSKYSIPISLILPILFMLSWLDLIPSIALPSFGNNLQLVFWALLLWSLANHAIFIYQLCEFFASTAGLYALWGSDYKRIFLSPIPQLILSILVVFSIQSFLSGDPFLGTLVVLPIITILTPIYTIFSSVGRIPRSGFAIYSFVAFYVGISTIFGMNKTSGYITNIIFTAIGIFYVAQSRARGLTEGTSKIQGSIISIYAIIYVLISLLIGSKGSSVTVQLLWQSNLLAVGLAPLVVIVYLKYKRRLEYYKIRDKTPFSKLLMELTSIIGSTILSELSKVFMEKFGSAIKVFKQIGTGGEKAKKTLDDALKFIRDSVGGLLGSEKTDKDSNNTDES